MENLDNIEFKNSTKVLSNSFMSNVFMWMFAALGLTAITAYFFGTSTNFVPMMFSAKDNGSISMNIIGWVVTLAPLAIIFIMSWLSEKLKSTTMILLFIVYSVLMGLSLSFIFLAYTSASIFKTFLITSVMFGVMAVVGYTTNTDLTKFGSILIMALIGLIVASIVNLFMHSNTLDYIISFVGVLLFTGLTAYDMQKIKKIGLAGLDDNETMKKIAIKAALNLYLDFLNLFLYLLKFFGKGRS